MLDRRSAMLTLSNNLEVTAHVIFAMREFTPKAHLIKLGTMGEYGTPNIDIEEGWINIDHKGRSDRFLFPRQAGSLYHTTKVMDTDLLWYYVRMWELRVTDLMQGPVYGIYTDESTRDERLLPHFAYDELFGTVVNRFSLRWSQIIRSPSTAQGDRRAAISSQDTLQCIRLALETLRSKESRGSLTSSSRPSASMRSRRGFSEPARRSASLCRSNRSRTREKRAKKCTITPRSKLLALGLQPLT